MSSARQARRERREAERKAAKLARKAEKLETAPNSRGFVSQSVTLAFEATPPMTDGMRPRLISEPKTQTRLPAVSSNGFVSQNRSAAPEQLSRRAEINRANAQRSTGPRSSSGKLASSRNSFKHGLASGQLIIDGEDPAQYEALLNDLLAQHQPATTTEELLVHEMARGFWLSQRAVRLQNECFVGGEVDEKRLAVLLRYQTTHERAFHKALNTLLGLQKQQRKLARGFVSQNRGTSADVAAAETGFVSQETTVPRDR